MKKLTKIVLTLISLLAISPSFGAGQYIPGTVHVCSGFECPTGQQFVIGDFNVRFNPAANSYGYIAATASQNLVQFFGVDSANGTSFSCGLTPSSPLFATALQIANAAKNGTTLTLYKNTSTSICTSVSTANYSYKLD